MKSQNHFSHIIFSILAILMSFTVAASALKEPASVQAAVWKMDVEDKWAQGVYLPVRLAASEVILCNNKVFEGYTKSPFVLQKDRDKNPAIKKIIRNCTFRNANKPGIVLNDAQNVLIEGNTFENIRTGIPGKGVHGINIRCRDACNINNITIRNNQFREIGADGIQMGEQQRYIKNVTIENNTFEGSETTGENGIDIKGVDGPIYVRGNNLHGFRPCETGQDCTGSGGPAMVVHAGSASGPPANVVIEANRFHDNIFGLIIRDASFVSVLNNEIFDNKDAGLVVDKSNNVTVLNNDIWGNPENMRIKTCLSCEIK